MNRNPGSSFQPIPPSMNSSLPANPNIYTENCSTYLSAHDSIALSNFTRPQFHSCMTCLHSPVPKAKSKSPDNPWP